MKLYLENTVQDAIFDTSRNIVLDGVLETSSFEMFWEDA
jgi:hypothetical protein